MISQQLKKYREDIGATQEQLAEKIGTSRQYYSMIESGQETPSLKRLKSIAQMLNISVEYLLSSQSVDEQKINQSVSESRGKYIRVTADGRYICTAKHCEWRIDCGGIQYCPGQGCLKEWQEHQEIQKLLRKKLAAASGGKGEKQ